MISTQVSLFLWCVLIQNFTADRRECIYGIFFKIITFQISLRPISRLNKKPIRKESKRIETLMHSVVQKTVIYELKMRDTNHEFTLKIESNKVEKGVLLEVHKPNYSEMQKKCKDLPVQVISGAGDYSKIKTQERARVGKPGELIAELTRLSRVVISPGQESGLTNMMFSKTPVHDYENLCSPDM